MQEFLGLTALGLCTASIFALAASGLVLTYTTTGIFNFAHGAILMLGAFAYWQLHVDWGWSTPLSLAAVLLVGAPLLGLGIERGVMRHLTGAPDTVRIVVTISLLVALLGLGLWRWPADEAYPISQMFEGHSFRIFDVGITYHRASGLVVAGLVALALRLLLYRTQAGLDMRASVDSRPLALLHGARPDRSAALAWVIGCSLAALAGILIAPTRHMNHLELTFLVVNAYAAAMFGRLRSLPMTFLGAVILGLADSYAIGYIPTTNQYFNTFRFAIPSVLLSFVLLALPSPQLRMRTGAASKEDIPRPGWVTAMATAAAIVTASVVLANVLTEADALRASKILGLGLIALSLVPLTGFAGQVSLCQMSFAGIGAVVMAHQGPAGEPFALVLVAIICGIVGAIVAIPSIRLSGLYLALSTAAFAVFLDSWVFRLPAFDLGPFNLDHGEPYRVQLFNLGVIPVRPLDLPVIDTTTNASRLVVLAVIFAAMYLLVVGVRRSSFGERLLALKDSPAAAATLGMNVTLLKLGVFALSAAMAGVGGALWAGTQGSVSPERFALVESLPLLLLAVVGGIGTAGGALFAGLILGGLPIAIGIWPWLGNVNRLLPGTMGVAMGRNPNGAVRDISSRYGIVREVPFVLAGLLATVVVVAGLAVGGSIDGWTLTIGLAIAFVVWPQTAEIIVARRRPKAMGGDLEWAGVDRPFTADDLRAVNAALALEEVSA